MKDENQVKGFLCDAWRKGHTQKVANEREIFFQIEERL
jgi:hypothetical protein